MNILCTGNINKPKLRLIVENLDALFKNSKHDIYLDKCLKDILNKNSVNYLDLYNPNISIDFVLCIGGDGSILSAVREMNDNQIPIAGIHIGNLGFLNKLNMDDYINILKNILDNDCINYDNKTLLEASFINGNNSKDSLLALNEIFINQGELSRLLTLDVRINDKYLNTYRCDGLIISTPLGSTAYSLSAGGPIVSYDVDCNIITPVSPHTLSSRPIILNTINDISVECPNTFSNIMISADGQESRIIRNSTSINIRKSEISAKFLKFNNEQSYFDKLRSNLGWHK
tara:strand:+ start:7906 stop:8766 length:861 start_codon:yes stop_codon:yes gene_type:complete